LADATRDRPGRNDACHCGSGLKYKRCCLKKDEAAARETQAEAAAETAVDAPRERSGPDPKKQQRATDQPWKRGFGEHRSHHRFQTPPKRGGG